MVVYAGTRWAATSGLAGLAVWALRAQGLTTTGLVLAGLAVAVVYPVQRMRFEADDDGVTVVNLLRAHGLAWSEISDIRLGSVKGTRCLEIGTHDGRCVHAWVVTTTGRAALDRSKVDSILYDLRRSLMLANGESQQDLDARSIEAALAAADGGRYSLASDLVWERRVDGRVMAEKLIERARERRQPGVTG
jgi:hypothetical protein